MRSKKPDTESDWEAFLPDEVYAPGREDRQASDGQSRADGRAREGTDTGSRGGGETERESSGRLGGVEIRVRSAYGRVDYDIKVGSGTPEDIARVTAFVSTIIEFGDGRREAARYV